MSSLYKLEETKIIFDERIEFDKYFISLGWGSQGDVYKIKINDKYYALKVFNGLQKEYLSNYENKMNIKIDSYVAPLKILYINNKFKGYLMDYCRGKDLEQRNLDISIDEFAESSTKLLKDTKKLTLLRYSIYDTFISNVMYDNGFKMIDMDCYPYESNKTLKEINELNNRRLNQMLVNIFINSTGLANMFFQNVELTKLMANCTSGKTTFEELFNEICTRAYNITDEEINKVSEIGKVLKKTQKRF